MSATKVPTLAKRDYSLVGPESKSAIANGLAEADWYQSPVPREVMRELLERRDGPAIRDTMIWLGLLGLFGSLGFALWGTAWAILPFLAYGAMYNAAGPRWHETSHGTPFKTDWMNNVLYEIASFMMMRESTVWRWSHTRHHSDTIIVGRDPEIPAPRPPNIAKLLLVFTGIPSLLTYWKKVFRHCMGGLYPDEATYIPQNEHRTVFFNARICALMYAAVVGSCFYFGSILPLLYVGLPVLYGAWLMPIYGFLEHLGLAENALDHRINSRTVRMNLINRFLYWNMNYHTEHHMFPLVPYHNLPRLHETIKADLPTPYPSIFNAWREMIPAVLRQRKDPGYYIKRKLPTPSVRAVANVAAKTILGTGSENQEGWVEIGPATSLDREDVLRFDYDQRTYAVYRTADDKYYATDGICTHGNTHLATGMVKGCLIECPKHNGRFDVRDGSPQRPPVCVALCIHPVKLVDGILFLKVTTAAQKQTTYKFRVVSNRNVATFIREVVLEVAPDSPAFDYQPGQYIQMNIPTYGKIPFHRFDIQEPYATVWRAQHVHDYMAENHTQVRRNYSLASNPGSDHQLRFNVRIATPPRGQDCNAGVGSSYMWNLQPGDSVTAIGPFGNFLIKDTLNEMVYLGGGSGMAPLRAHLSYLLETLKTGRKVSYWYGARSRQELFYQDYFEGLARQFPNFHFHPALSEPLPEDRWTSSTGFIHDVLLREYLEKHPNPAAIEYYMCGPQPMIQAARKMLADLGVSSAQIAFDEF